LRMFCDITFWISTGALWMNDPVQYEAQDPGYNRI
jgi:hypothetical protein